MKPTTQTDDLLILDHTPWLMGILLIVFFLVFTGLALGFGLRGQPFVGIGFMVGALFPGLMLVLFTARVQVLFDRPAGLIEFRRRSFRGYTRDTVPIAAVRDADLESSQSFAQDSGSSTTYRPVLNLKNGDVRPLLKIYTNKGRQVQVVDAINDWLNTGRTQS